MRFCILIHKNTWGREGWLPYETDGDARQKCWINPQKETILRMAQAFLYQKT